MLKEELAKKLYEIFNRPVISLEYNAASAAKYLLGHYHLIKKEGTKCIEGKLNIVWGNDGITCGIDIDYEKSEGVPDYDGKHATLFIEEEKCE